MMSRDVAVVGSRWFLGLAGSLLGIVMVLSPVTVVALAVLALIVLAARRGLTGTELRVVTWVLLAAIALRVAALAALFLTSDPYRLSAFPFEGDGRFLKQQSLLIRSVWLGVPIDSLDFQAVLGGYGSYGWSSYTYVLAYIQYLLGPAPYAIHFFSICCHVGAAVLLFRISRAAYGAAPAGVALVTTLFLPTVFMWSVSALKESLFLLLLSVVLFAALAAVRGRTLFHRGLAVAAVVATTLAADTVREGALLIVVAALGLALAGTFLTRRPWALALALVLLLPAGAYVLGQPAVQERMIAHLHRPAGLHIGHVRTEGHGYKLLDERFYSAGSVVMTMTWPEAQRFVLRGLASVILVPVPWQIGSTSQMIYLPQQLIWYCLVLLALIGVIEGWRGDVFVTWLLLGMSSAGAVGVALMEGNIGTMVRHRDAIVPFVACLSGLGIASLLASAGRLASSHGEASRVEWVPGSDPLPAWIAAVRPHGRRPGLFARAAETSVISRVILASIRGSVLCRGLDLLLRPTIGYSQDRRALVDARASRVLSHFRDSRFVAGIGRAAEPFLQASRTALVAVAIERVRVLETWQRLRLLGWTLLVGSLTAAALGPFVGHAWPSVFPWALMVIVAAALIVASRSLARAPADAGSRAVSRLELT